VQVAGLVVKTFPSDLLFTFLIIPNDPDPMGSSGSYCSILIIRLKRKLDEKISTPPNDKLRGYTRRNNTRCNSDNDHECS
jgi:hypothetical protein